MADLEIAREIYNFLEAGPASARAIIVHLKSKHDPQHAAVSKKDVNRILYKWKENFRRSDSFDRDNTWVGISRPAAAPVGPDRNEMRSVGAVPALAGNNAAPAPEHQRFPTYDLSRILANHNVSEPVLIRDISNDCGRVYIFFSDDPTVVAPLEGALRDAGEKDLPQTLIVPKSVGENCQLSLDSPYDVVCLVLRTRADLETCSAAACTAIRLALALGIGVDIVCAEL